MSVFKLLLFALHRISVYNPIGQLCCSCFLMSHYKFLQSVLVCRIHHHFVELNSCWEYIYDIIYVYTYIYIIQAWGNIGDMWILGWPSIMLIILDAEGNILPVTDGVDDMGISVAWSDDEKDCIQVVNLTVLWAAPLCFMVLQYCGT